MKNHLNISWQPELQSSSLIVGWSVDASGLGARVADYLNRKLGGESFCEIEPVDFFPLGGVAIADNLVQFPESKFYSCPGKDLVVFRSDPPDYQWYKFLSLVLDTAGHYCHVKEVYTIGGMISMAAHTAPRELIGTFNSVELKHALSRYNIDTGLDYETPPGQRPTISSFLIWAAKNRNIPGVSLWVPIPFYMITVDDPGAERRVLEFLNQRFDLRLDLSDLDEEIWRQNQAIAGLRNSFPDIDESIKRLESNLTLSNEESQRLVTEIEKILGEKRS